MTRNCPVSAAETTAKWLPAGAESSQLSKAVDYVTNRACAFAVAKLPDGELVAFYFSKRVIWHQYQQTPVWFLRQKSNWRRKLFVFERELVNANYMALTSKVRKIPISLLGNRSQWYWLKQNEDSFFSFFFYTLDYPFREIRAALHG